MMFRILVRTSVAAPRADGDPRHLRHAPRCRAGCLVDRHEAPLEASEPDAPGLSHRSQEPGRRRLDPVLCRLGHAARLERLRANARAWRFFESQPPSYRKTAIWWVESARQEKTREKRFAALLADSAAGLAVGPLRRMRPTAPAGQR